MMMVERIGLAICDSLTTGKVCATSRGCRCRRAAIAVLEEMLKPTPEMVEAVKQPWPSYWPKEGPDFSVLNTAYLIDQASARSQWQAMIRAALDETALQNTSEGKGE